MLFGVPAASFWRIAKRTGHGRIWDAIFGVHLLFVLLMAISVSDERVVPYCRSSLDSFSCFTQFLMPFVLCSFCIQLFVLAVKRCPTETSYN